MGCKSLFVNLGGGGGGTVNTGMLQIAGGVALDATLRFVEDQAGTDSPLQLSTTRASIVLPDCTVPFTFGRFNATINEFNGIGFDSGTLYPFYNMQGFIAGVNRYRLGTNGFVLGDTDAHTQNGYLSVKGTGANIASFRNSSNVEVASLDNNGIFISSANRVASGGFYGISGRFYFDSPGDSIITLYNNAGNSFTRQNFGGTTTSYPAIAASNTPAALAAKDATGANLIPFSAEDFTSGNLSTGTLITARPMQFGDKGTVSTGNDLGLDAQIAVEHNGAVYYIPCSTSLIP